MLKFNFKIIVGTINDLSTFVCDPVTTAMHFQALTYSYIVLLLFTILEVYIVAHDEPTVYCFHLLFLYSDG
jgi:hypothetical protein